MSKTPARGLLIDCSRVIERHGYYLRLVEWMAAWGYDTLVLHFTDDHGLSVRLPGFADIAHPRALTTAQVRKLIAHANAHGIEVIPELATFGHTRYLTDQPKYAHLYAGRKTRRRTYNAVDPLNPETIDVMRRLIRATANLFPSKRLHIGCDEVNLDAFCRARGGLDWRTVWTEHVNRMIGLALDADRTPLFWADHLVQEPAIAAGIDKRAIPVWWDYAPTGSDTPYRALEKAGFKKIWLAPSTSNGRIRFLPTWHGLDNNDRMAGFARKHGADGFLNTVWEPYYGLQAAHDYGIAYGGAAANAEGRVDRAAFNRRFVREALGTDTPAELAAYLARWPDLHIDHEVTYWLVGHRDKLSQAGWDSLRAVNKLGREILPLATDYVPAGNPETWHAMRVAARAAWTVSEYAMLSRWGGSPERKRAYNATLREVRRDVAAEWDRTRFPDDPRKKGSPFSSDPYNYAIVLLRRLRRA